MGQCQCLYMGDMKDSAPRRQSKDLTKSPFSTPNTVRKRRENLMSNLNEDFKEDNYTHLFTSNINLDNFEVVKVIGRGSYAKIYLVKKYADDSDDVKFFALKVLKKKMLFDKEQMHHTMQEREILMEISHPFIIKLHYAFQSPDRFYFVLEYVNGGDLFYHLRRQIRFSEKESRFYACEVILAIDFLHENGFIYRDLKPENILMDSEGHLKLTDFGLSKALGNQATDLTNTFCGTPQYLAPELIQKKGYNKMIDWWGVGILIYEMVVGQPPFNERNNKRVVYDIANKPYENRDWFTKSLKDLLTKLLCKDPTQRLGAPEVGGINSIKTHPFFNGIDWNKVLTKEYKPPIRPKVKSESDTKNIDGIFLNEDIKHTPAEGSFSITLLNKMHFQNFTYNEEVNHTKVDTSHQLSADPYEQAHIDNSIGLQQDHHESSYPHSKHIIDTQ